MLKVVKESSKALFREIINAKNEDDLLYLSLRFLIRISEKRMRKTARKKKWMDKDTKAKNKVEYDIYRRDSLLEEHITSLPKELRLISVLYFYDGMTSKQIAKILQISEKNVLTIIGEARTQLYEFIVNEGVKKYNEYV